MKAVGSQACTLVFVDLEARQVVLGSIGRFWTWMGGARPRRAFRLGSYQERRCSRYELFAAGKVIEKYGPPKGTDRELPTLRPPESTG